MSKSTLFFYFMVIISLSACKTDTKTTENSTVTTPSNAPAVTVSSTADVEHKEVSRRQVDANGKETVAAGYMIKYPSVKTGNAALTATVKKWVNEFVSGQAGFKEVLEPEAGYAPYVVLFREALASNKELKAWELEIKDNILYNTPKVLSLYMEAYTMYGGAHPSHTIQLNSFDPTTGEILSLDKLVTNKNGLLALCEKIYRKDKAEAFKQGFNFTKDSPFKLAKNFAIVPQGVMFYYNPYEIAPYAIGESEFTIPFSDLDKVMDLKKYL